MSQSLNSPLMTDLVREINDRVHQLAGLQTSSSSVTFKLGSQLHGKCKVSEPAEEVDSAPLQTFTTPDGLSNLILKVEDTDLYVHKEVLASWSPVFMAMFTDGFEESHSGTVTLTGKKLVDVVLLLNILYPPNAHSVTAENVMQILPLANEYGMESLKAKCEPILSQFEPSLKLLAFAHMYNMPGLLEKCVKNCAAQPLSLIDYRKHQSAALPDNLLLQVYREKIVLLTEEVKLLTQQKECRNKQIDQAMKWGVSPNCYPCELHTRLNEDCRKCLHAFREFAMDNLKDSTPRVSEKKRKL